MDWVLKKEIEEFIQTYDTAKGGSYASNTGLRHNSTWIFTRFERMKNKILMLEAERNAMALYIARKELKNV